MRLQSALVAAIMVGLVACGGGPVVEEPVEIDEPVERLVIYTVNYPLAYFAERIGGDLVEVVFPAPPDEDPAYWSPDAETIAAYQSADLILLNGADYAKWVARATLPASKMVDTSSEFSDRLIPLEGATTHSHGPEGEHEHTGWAFTTWLDPMFAMQQAEAVANALSSLLPEKSMEIQARLEELRSDLQTLDTRLGAAAAAIGGAPLFFSHPVYQYLIQRYELNAHQLHWEPGEALDGHARGHLKKALASFPAKWVVWEGAPLLETGEALDELGIGSVLFDPCANTPVEGDYLTIMDANAGSLETIAETMGDNNV
jgi:zinc transport system substrate-binding protein